MNVFPRTVSTSTRTSEAHPTRLTCVLMAFSLQGRALGQILPKNGSFLKNLDKFDHVEFGITARDARAMPVGTRVLIELVLNSVFQDALC